jgi:hypothetical protein
MDTAKVGVSNDNRKSTSLYILEESQVKKHQKVCE